MSAQAADIIQMYELMVIAKIDSADEVFGKVEKFLKDIKAESLKVERLGKKLLAYPIAKQTEAEYFLYNFEADSQALKSLSDKIRLEPETILRHLLLKAAKPRKLSKRRSVGVAAVEQEEKTEIKPKVTVTTKSGTAKETAEAASKKEKKTVKSKVTGKNKQETTNKKGKKK